MVLKRNSIFSTIGSILFQLTGIPVVVIEHKLYSKVEKVYGWYCFSVKLLVALFSTLIILISETHYTTLLEFYKEVLWNAWCWQILAYSLLFYFRRQSWLSKMLGNMENINKWLQFERSKERVTSTIILGVMIIVVYVPGIIISIINDNIIILLSLGFSDVTFPKFSLAVFALMPIVLLSWTVTYNLTLLYSKELEFIGNLTNSVSSTKDEPEINAVMPFVEEVSPVIYCISGQETTVHSISCCNPWYCSFPQSRYLLKICLSLKDFHLEINRFYNSPIAMTMLGNVLVLPMMFVSTYHSNEEFIKEIYYMSSPLVNSFWVCASVAPILLNEWNRYKNAYLEINTSKLIYLSDKKAFRNLLSRLALIAKDQYTESPWSFITLDYDLLPVMVDLIILLATTFIIPQ